MKNENKYTGNAYIVRKKSNCLLSWMPQSSNHNVPFSLYVNEKNTPYKKKSLNMSKNYPHERVL